MLRILLPPSEGKSDESGNASLSEKFPEIARDSHAVFRVLDKARGAERRSWYGIRDAEKLKAAHARNRLAIDSLGLPAIQRYTGVVYQNIDYATLKQKRRANSRIYVVSALYGLVPANAPIADYKLMATPRLAKHWLPINTERAAQIAKPTDEWLNLLSQTYAKAVPSDIGVAVDFRVQGGKKAAGHFGKAIKGRFVRWLVENKIDSIRDIGGFDEDGYRFDGTNFVQD